MSERRVASSSSSFYGGGDKLSSNLHGESLGTILELDREYLESILELVVKHLRDAIQSTVENVPSDEKQDRCFLSNGDLERIIDSRLLAQLFKALVTDIDLFNSQEDGHEESQRNNGDALTVDEVVDRCIAMTMSRKKLLALFLYQKCRELLVLFMQWLISYGDDAPSDDSMPFSSMYLHHYNVPEKLHNNIIRDQKIFTPITIQKSKDLKVGTQDRLPFIAGKTDFMKSSSGTVCEVTIAQRHFAIKDGPRITTANPGGAKAIVLKVFKDKRNMDVATADSRSELRIRQDLQGSNIHHKAFVLDLGSLTIVDSFGNPISQYLMFEPAISSLDDFLGSEECFSAWVPNGVSLLLSKFVDIVDALAFLHDNLKVLHLDIQPANILVFVKEKHDLDAHEGYRRSLTWSLNDFTCATRLPLISSTVLTTRPVSTYQGPESQWQEYRAGHGSDLWSIGCVALQVLAFVLGGPTEVSKLDERLAVDFPERHSRERLFYITSDTYTWMNGDVGHYRYQYLKDYYPVTGQISGTLVRAAINPQVIQWSNVLHKSYEGNAEQKLIQQYLELVFCSVLLIDYSKRISAAHLRKELQVIQSRWKLFEDSQGDYFRYQPSITPFNIINTHRQIQPAVRIAEPSKSNISRTITKISTDQEDNFNNATIRRPQTNNLYPAIESDDTMTARSELERDVGQLKRYCPGSNQYPIHYAIHCKAYEVLKVLLEFSDAETANLVCNGRTALELACNECGDVRALGVINQYQQKFDVPGGLYKQYRKALDSEVRKALEDVSKISSVGKKKKSWSLRDMWNKTSSFRPHDATRDIDQGLHPAARHESSLPDGTSFDNKEMIMFDVESNTQLLQIESIESSDSDLTQHKALPIYGEPIDQIKPVHAQIDAPFSRSLPIKSADGHEDVATDSDLLGTRNDAFSTDDTLVGTAGRTLESSTFNLYEHRKLSLKDLKNGPSDVASLLSRTDASEVGSSATLVEYQHAATDVIAKAFLGNNEMFRTYSKAIEVLGTDRFLRNNSRLLQEFSADLKVQKHVPSKALVVRFLATSVGRRLVSAAICDEIHHNKYPRPQRQLDSMEDKKMMLNRFLGDINSAVQSKPTERIELNLLEKVDTEGDLPVRKRDDDVVSMKSISDGELETTMPTNEKLESLEEAVWSLMSGQPIEKYQKKLQQWLDRFMQGSQDNLKPVGPIGDASKEASKHPLGTTT